MTESLAPAVQTIDTLRSHLLQAVIGRDEVIDWVLIALMCDGHVLLEDYPGSGKTTLARTLGGAIEDDVLDDDIPDFSRIQFTPDMLPSDVTGTMVFQPELGKLEFRRGPIFAYVVLGDEINRTSPKVQSAMLEAMAEKQVTVDGVTHQLDELFFVIATQNPLDLAGTYPLPVAQLDRFLFKIKMDFIDRDSEVKILRSEFARADEELARVPRGQVVEARRLINQHVSVHPKTDECLVDIAQALRQHPLVLQGVSTRCLVAMRPALRCAALMRGRDFVTADDIHWLAPLVFGHRMLLEPHAKVEEIVEECCVEPIEAFSRVQV